MKLNREDAFTLTSSRLNGTELVDANSNHSFGRHTHDQFGIGLISKGAQQSWSGRGLVEACAGDLITVNPGEVHDGKPVSDGGRSWQMIYFDPLLIQQLGDVSSSGKNLPIEFTQPVVRRPDAAITFRKLYIALNTKYPDNSDLNTEALLLTLLDKLTDDSQEQTRKTDMTFNMSEIISKLSDESIFNHALADLAEMCSMSRFQFLRAFKKTTGLTPHAFLLQKRLQKAKTDIRSGKPLIETAINSGFSDQSHMTRIFVRTFGYSPGQYLKLVHS